MQHCAAHNDQFLRSEIQLSIFRHRALRLVYKTYLDLRNSESTMPPTDAWNANMMNIISAARAHIEFCILLAYTQVHHRPPTNHITKSDQRPIISTLPLRTHYYNLPILQ